MEPEPEVKKAQHVVQRTPGDVSRNSLSIQGPRWPDENSNRPSLPPLSFAQSLFPRPVLGNKSRNSVLVLQALVLSYFAFLSGVHRSSY